MCSIFSDFKYPVSFLIRPALCSVAEIPGFYR